MMAPQVTNIGEWSTHWEPITGLQMLAAMDSESTDGEGSLLSYGGIDHKLFPPPNPCVTAPSNNIALPSKCKSSLETSQSLLSSDAPVIVEIEAEISSDHAGSTDTVVTTTVNKHVETTTVASPHSVASNNDNVTETAPSTSHSAVNDNLEAGFYFESDHLALKGNSDYQVMLRTVVKLESQRTVAINDLETLIQCKAKALEDPIAFVDKLQHQVDMGLPTLQNICEVPQMDWEYYTSSCDPAQFKQPKHITRHLNKRQAEEGPSKSIDLSTSSGYGSRPTTPISSPSSCFSITNYSTNQSSFSLSDPFLVRGRHKDDKNKSKTFNQLWTVEEQRRLEDLLVKHQPEEVEMRRWEKVARELGNRTATQVQSRVQKYFIKLAKCGLPIPGRTPYMPANIRKKQRHQHHRHQRFLFPSSTFLSSHEPPVFMGDDDDDTYSYTGSSVDYSDVNIGSQDDISDDDEIPADLRDTDEYRQLLRMKRLRRHKQHDVHRSRQHVGYKCDRCDCEPIIGIRWHCKDCPAQTSLDFCDNCVDFVFETATHKSSHTMEPVKVAEVMNPHTDSDYTRFMGASGDYNYLDPNYMPAS